MAKATDEPKIEFILTELRNGATRKPILQKFTTTYKTCVKTFDNYLKIATERYKVELQAKESIRNDKVKELLENEVEGQILSELELDIILSRIVDGGIKIQSYFKGESVVRETEPTEIVAAADKLYKRKGSYAPAKVASTDPEGRAVTLTPTINVYQDGPKLSNSEDEVKTEA